MQLVFYKHNQFVMLNRLALKLGDEGSQDK